MQHVYLLSPIYVLYILYNIIKHTKARCLNYYYHNDDINYKTIYSHVYGVLFWCGRCDYSMHYGWSRRERAVVQDKASRPSLHFIMLVTWRDAGRRCRRPDMNPGHGSTAPQHLVWCLHDTPLLKFNLSLTSPLAIALHCCKMWLSFFFINI